MIPIPNPPEGVVVVDAEGGVSWWSPTPPAVATVEIAVGAGVCVHVDAADPAAVSGWAVEPGGDADALGVAFGNRGFADWVRTLAGGGESVAVADQERLITRWARQATVAAVERWTVRPLHEGALLLDRAASEHHIGNPLGAARLFMLASPCLVAIAQDSADGVIPGGAVRELIDIAASGSAALTDPDIRAEFAAASDLAEAALLGDDRFTAALSEWEATLAVAATDLGVAPGAQSGLDAESVDPLTVPPRILAWLGADNTDLRIEYHPDLDQVVVSAALAGDLDSSSPEAGQLLAYAADKATGALTASAPMLVHGHTVSAQLPCRGRAPGDLRFGILDASTEVDDLRTGPNDAAFIGVDRWMIQAWNHRRAALAAVYSVAADSDDKLLTLAKEEQDKKLYEAKHAAKGALGILSKLAADPAIATSELGESVRARQAAIERFVRGLDTLAESYERPLLSEMLPLEPWKTAEDGR